MRETRITRAVVDIIAPQHDRTSCSDGDRCNGYVASSEPHKVLLPRCTRCYLLHVAEEGGRMDSRLRISVTVGHSDEYVRALHASSRALQLLEQKEMSERTA